MSDPDTATPGVWQNHDGGVVLAHVIGWRWMQKIAGEPIRCGHENADIARIQLVGGVFIDMPKGEAETLIQALNLYWEVTAGRQRS